MARFEHMVVDRAYFYLRERLAELSQRGHLYSSRHLQNPRLAEMKWGPVNDTGHDRGLGQMVVNDRDQLLSQSFQIGECKGINRRQPFSQDEIAHFGCYPLSKIIRIDPFHITMTEKITVRVEIDGVERHLFDELYQASFVFSLSPQNLTQLAASGKPKDLILGFH